MWYDCGTVVGSRFAYSPRKEICLKYEHDIALIFGGYYKESGQTEYQTVNKNILIYYAYVFNLDILCSKIKVTLFALINNTVWYKRLEC